MGAKTALSRRWVVFFQSLINLGIVSLDGGNKDDPPELRRLILASVLSKISQDRVAPEDDEEEDTGALDNLSANSDPTPIVEVGPEELIDIDNNSSSKDKGKTTTKPKPLAVGEIIREEDHECDDEQANSLKMTANGETKYPRLLDQAKMSPKTAERHRSSRKILR